MKKIIISILFFVQIILAFGQNATISGIITDSITGEKLISTLILEKNSQRNTTSNNFGYFSFSVPKNDNLNLIISNFGYETFYVNVYLANDTVLNVLLQPKLNEIEEIVVISAILSNSELGSVSLTPKQLNTMPALGGEKDLFKSFQLLPGVMQGTDGKSNIFVRGGSSDQNLIILDDVPMYSIEHFTGFFSVFNNDAINSVKLLKGGFPARYGGRLSSVMDIRMKDGNMNKFGGNISVGLLTAKFFIETPIIKDKMSVMVSARRSFIDLFLTPYEAISSGAYLNYNFYDFNSKINYKINSQNRIYLSFYSGDDKTRFLYSTLGKNSSSSSSKMTGGNLLSAFRWYHIYSNKLFGNFTTSVTNFKYGVEFNNVDKENKEIVYDVQNSLNSSILDFSAKYEFEYSLSNFFKINLGAEYINHLFKPAEISYSEMNTYKAIDFDTNIVSQRFNSNEISAYIENQIKVSRFFKTNIGFRENIYIIQNKRFISHEPRIILNILPINNLSFKASYAKVSQNIHSMQVDDNEFFTTLWVPATEICPPEQATHYSVGVEIFLFKKFNLSTEFYYKTMRNLVSFDRGSFWQNASSWETNVNKDGLGKSYGVETLFTKNAGNLTGWVSYAYSKTTRQFQNINFGKVYPDEFDRPHSFKVFGNYKLNENLNFSISWILQSGRPVNLSLGYYYSVNSNSFDFENMTPQYELQETELFASKNSIRMKPYHRMDIALNWTKQKKRGVRTWSFSIYNLYNQKNALYYYYTYSYDENGHKIRSLYQYTLLPFIPSVSYSFKF